MQGGQDVDDHKGKIICSGLLLFLMAVATAKANTNPHTWHG